MRRKHLSAAGKTVGEVHIYKCTLVAHDYLFFTTKGFRETSPSTYIGNYALMYAINRHIQTIQRNASGNKPFYEEDMGKVTLYATPATPATPSKTNIVRLGAETIRWTNQALIYFTYNSINTLSQTTEVPRENLPQIGKKAKHPPLNSFEFFVIGGEPSGIVRLGKKQVPCRIYSKRLSLESIGEGVFKPSHPVNPLDLESFKAANIQSGEIVLQTPPLLVNSAIRGKHYICRNGYTEYFIAKPDARKYASVNLL
jgi:CRISPR type I-D-associated protein Csc1